RAGRRVPGGEAGAVHVADTDEDGRRSGLGKPTAGFERHTTHEGIPVEGDVVGETGGTEFAQQSRRQVIDGLSRQLTGAVPGIVEQVDVDVAPDGVGDE